MKEYDVAVIGGGVAGLSAAYFLSEHCDVLVLEREDQLAYHSSGRSAAMYIEGYENEVVQELTLAGREFFFQPPEGFSDYPLLGPCGGLTVGARGEEAKLERYFEVWSDSCPELQRVSTHEATELVPILSGDWLGGAVYDPSWKSIDVHELLMGFERGIRSNGGTILKSSEAIGLEESREGWLIDLGKEALKSSIVVNAAGAWANSVAALASIDAKPLNPLRRTAVIIPAPDDMGRWPMVHTIAGNLYFRPESPGMLVCPQDETPSEAMDAFALELDVARVLEEYEKVNAHSVERVLKTWAGLRTFAEDRKPLVGYDKQSPSFFWLAGQGGFGVQTSPGLGRLASELILNRELVPPNIDVNRYSD